MSARDDETMRLELGDRVAAAMKTAEKVIRNHPLCIMSPAQLDGLACIDCNRPASDGPMVPVIEGSGLFRCADEIGCLPFPGLVP